MSGLPSPFMEPEPVEGEEPWRGKEHPLEEPHPEWDGRWDGDSPLYRDGCGPEYWLTLRDGLPR